MNLVKIFSLIGSASMVYAIGGSWSKQVPFTISPTSGAILPDGNLLLWAANTVGGFGYDKGNYYILVQPTADDKVKVLSQNPAYFTSTQLFCTGTANLANGNILLNGGTDKQAVIEFDWRARKFSMKPSMTQQRGYNADVYTTANQVFTVGGSWSNPDWMPPVDGEIYDGKKWTHLSNIKGKLVAGTLVNGKEADAPDMGGERDSDYHHWLVAYKDNQGNNMVAHLGPVRSMHAFNTNAATKGSVKYLGLRGDDPYSMFGNIAQYQPGKVLKFGGSYRTPGPDGGDADSMADSALIDITALPKQGGVNVTKLPNMNYPRSFSNSIILPGGKVMIIGGQTVERRFTDYKSVLAPEIYDPVKNTFTNMASSKVGRNYHSVAFLLPSGKVMSAGGGLCGLGGACNGINDGNNPNVHYDAEFYTPDYLLDGLAAKRPIIKGVDKNGKAYTITDKIQVTTAGCGKQCTYELIRLYSTTHTVNNDQLRVPLVINNFNGDKAFVKINQADYPFIISGYYYLFAINKAGTPSIAKIIQLLRN
jgi:large repetitive protein